jgi:hypothetical protein
MVGPQLNRELTLAEAAEAKVEFPHREGVAEQRHMLPPHPLNACTIARSRSRRSMTRLSARSAKCRTSWPASVSRPMMSAK